MESSQLNSGDSVIPLAGLIFTTAIVSGSLNSALVTWKYNHTWWLSLIALFIGALVCGLISKKLGGLVFPITSEGQIFVAKAGGTALPLTLKASVIGSIVGLVVSGLSLSMILGGAELLASTWILTAAISAFVAIFWGALSALV